MQKRETASIKGDKEGSILGDKWMKAYVLHQHRHLHMSVYRGSVHNWQKLDNPKALKVSQSAVRPTGGRCSETKCEKLGVCSGLSEYQKHIK